VKCLHPEDRDRVLEESRRSNVSGAPFRAEYRLIAKDGGVVWVRDEAVLLRDEAGLPAAWQGVMIDVTERKAAEEALGRQEEWFRKLTEHSSDIVFVVDRDHVVRYVSPSVTRVLGWSPGDALGTDVLRLAHREDREAARQALEVALSRPGVGPTIETRTRHRDGTWRWIEMIGTNLLDDPAVGGLVINARDVTERRSAEEILRQSESGLQQALAVLREADQERRKLVAHLLEAEAAERGRMAEGIEDRSLQDMAAVGMRLEALRRSLDDPDQLAAIDKLRGTVEQALARLKRVLVELRPRALEQDGLAAALEQYLRAAFPTGAPRVSVDSRLAREPALEVRSVAYRIAQEAIASVARIGGAAHVVVRLEDRDSGVLVRVVDDGAGFRQEDLEDDRRLRLSSMEERARLAGGWLRVDSEPGRGTTVEFWVPGREEPGT
jgi:PAS domain S-box-containing protein